MLNVILNLNLDEMDLPTVESKATYEEIKDYVLKHTGLKVSSLYIAQVKQKCPPEKEMAIRVVAAVI